MSNRNGKLPLHRESPRPHAPHVRKRTVLIFFIAAIVIYLALNSYTEPQRQWKKYDGVKVSKDFLRHLGEAPLAPENTTQRTVRLFIPADGPHLNLCKTVLSAVGLGYPMPTLINWEGRFNRPDWAIAGSHIAKLESWLAAIEQLYIDGAQDDDLAILVDGHDMWFQLPPSVLIDRFNDLNKKADRRVAEEWAWLDEKDFPIRPPRQNIVVTAAKDCHPRPSSGSDAHYDHWPESPMREDLYGNETDIILPILDPARRFKNVRPRCINSGMIMGTMAALRAALQRSMEKINHAVREGRQLWSDQALFAEVMGDQFMFREWMVELGASWDGKRSVVDLDSLQPEVRDIAYSVMKDRKRYEFGIGLDYEFLTMPPTCSAEEDGEFVELNDKAAIERGSKKAGVPGDVRVLGVPRDLKRAKVQDTYPYMVPWGELELYTDFFFGNTPVAIHHNAYVDNLKEIRIRDWWERMWYYPDMRALVISNINHASRTRVVGRKEVVDQETIFYNAKAQDTVTVFEIGDPWATFDPISWEGVCQTGAEDWAEPIFGDGKGAFLLNGKAPGLEVADIPEEKTVVKEPIVVDPAAEETNP